MQLRTHARTHARTNPNHMRAPPLLAGPVLASRYAWGQRLKLDDTTAEAMQDSSVCRTERSDESRPIRSRISPMPVVDRSYACERVRTAPVRIGRDKPGRKTRKAPIGSRASASAAASLACSASSSASSRSALSRSSLSLLNTALVLQPTA